MPWETTRFLDNLASDVGGAHAPASPPVDHHSALPSSAKYFLSGSTIPVLGGVLLLTISLPASAADPTEIQQLRDEIQQLKTGSETRIKDLEKRLEQAESAAQQARETARKTAVTVERTPSPAPPANPPARSNAFNPDISLILEGSYANLSRNPEDNEITGFQTAEEVGPQKRGFSLAESELDLFATIDPYFYGGLNLALSPDNEVEVEEAYVQTTALSHGFTLKGGRFFSSLGYLNEIHQHAWDFFDAPLAYQAFLGTGPTGNHGEDGLQVRWIAPTELFLEFGAEIGRGKDFPGTDRNENGIDSEATFVHVGGDVGLSQSYLAGLSFLHSEPRDRGFDQTDLRGNRVTNGFSGDSHLLALDGVWKYAPNGDPTYSNFKLQGEYLYRWEDGDVIYDIDALSQGAQTDEHSSRQSGAYLQGVYQFRPRWRVGLRGDWLFAHHLDFGANNANLPRPDFDPSKYSAMIDFSPSEFSRLRLQYSYDQSRKSADENEIFLQYIYSLGTHGAHQF